MTVRALRDSIHLLCEEWPDSGRREHGDRGGDLMEGSPRRCSAQKGPMCFPTD